MNAPLLVVSGPSGVGKSTVVKSLLAAHHLPLRRAITATTRAPRSGEIVGEDYHYWTPEQFQNELASGRMLEHAIVHGRDYYGTPVAEVDPHRARGVGVILVIDVQGAAAVRALKPGDHLSVFLLPPSLEELKTRLASRGTEDAAALARRWESAQCELARQNEFDMRLVNDKLHDTVMALQLIIREQFSLRGIPCSMH